MSVIAEAPTFAPFLHAVQHLGFQDRLTARVRGGIDTELIVDNFAGAGGASLGIEAALGRCVDIAINHSRKAVAMHQVNHPHTAHLCEDVWDVDPVEACKGRPIGLAWFSPDCKHFSKAKGGRPLSKKIRGLAWIVIKWAKLSIWQRPRVIILENVEEFVTWGPLDAAGNIIKAKKGQTFLRWVAMLRNLGYEVEHRELVAADYGVPTTRKRFFLIARCDGQPIRWPRRTHAPRDKARTMGLKPWRSAAECIDWSLPCPSIFERKRPLADATLRRIARGIVKYVLAAKEPFIVTCNHAGMGGLRSAAEPMRTVTGSRDANGVVVPSMVNISHYNGRDNANDAKEPMPTLTAHPKGGHMALASAMLSKYHGDRPGDASGRACDPAEPIKTLDTQNRFGVVTASLKPNDQALWDDIACEYLNGSITAEQFEEAMDAAGAPNDPAGAAAFIAKHYGGVVGHDVDRPLGTVTGVDHHSLVGATLVGAGGPSYSGKPTSPADPIGTVMVENHRAIASATLVGVGGRAGQSPEKSPDDPVSTITAKGDRAIAAAHLTKLYGTNRDGASAEDPMPTVTGGGQHIGDVRAFLVKYYGTGGQDQSVASPLHTLTAKARMGLVSIAGEDYQIADIGLRMLQPKELLRAQFGRFADEYILHGTKADQVAGIGNSVCPELAEAIVRANVQAVAGGGR